MQDVFEKIIEKLANKRKTAERLIMENPQDELDKIQTQTAEDFASAYGEAIEIIKQAEAEYNNGWIPCSEEMPPVETEVFILAKRKFKDGYCKYIRTTAMYEDGNVSECYSCWVWEYIEGKWDEENDCYIIPEGWYEYRHYNPDDVYNNVVDDEVIAWQPLPTIYKEGDRE